jgi:hypothetical protein
MGEKKERISKVNKEGSMLSFVVLMTVVLSIAGLALLRVGHNAKMKAAQATSEISARAAADAGMIQALSAMNKKIESELIWDASELPSSSDIPLPNCQASYSYQIKGDVESGYNIISTGSTQLAKKNTTSKLKLKGLFDYAIFSDEGIDLKMGTTIDGYNYDVDDPLLQLGTNSIEEAAMSMKNGVTVIGDVVIGPEGDIDFAIDSRHEADISGDTYALSDPRSLPIITVPDYLLASASKGSVTGGEIIVSDGKFDTIELLGINQVVTIDGSIRLYIVGDVTIGNTCEIQIVNVAKNPDASLILYLGGNYTQKTDGHFNNLTKDTNKLTIVGLEGCQHIDFLSDSTFYGAIYAPCAEMILHNAVEIYGAVVVDSFTQLVAADFTYDASLRDVQINDIGVSFAIDRWYEE